MEEGILTVGLFLSATHIDRNGCEYAVVGLVDHWGKLVLFSPNIIFVVTQGNNAALGPVWVTMIILLYCLNHHGG